MIKLCLQQAGHGLGTGSLQALASYTLGLARSTRLTSLDCVFRLSPPIFLVSF